MALRTDTTEVKRFHSRASFGARKMLGRKVPSAARWQVGRVVCKFTVPWAAAPLVVAVADTMQISTAVTPAQACALAATWVALKY